MSSRCLRSWVRSHFSLILTVRVLDADEDLVHDDGAALLRFDSLCDSRLRNRSALYAVGCSQCEFPGEARSMEPEGIHIRVL